MKENWKVTETFLKFTFQFSFNFSTSNTWFIGYDYQGFHLSILFRLSIWKASTELSSCHLMAMINTCVCISSTLIFFISRIFRLWLFLLNLIGFFCNYRYHHESRVAFHETTIHFDNYITNLLFNIFSLSYTSSLNLNGELIII